MPFYHCSPRDFPDGFRLTPAACRCEMTEWAGTPGYRDDVVYLFEGSGSPSQLLSLAPCIGEHTFLYEVDPEGDAIPTPSRGPIWGEVHCGAAIVKECVHRPASVSPASP
jgi:hypothetical protein